MVFGVSYHVIGRADCPYFARAERLAQVRTKGDEFEFEFESEREVRGGADKDKEKCGPSTLTQFVSFFLTSLFRWSNNPYLSPVVIS